jgi:hypothetical protein
MREDPYPKAKASCNNLCRTENIWLVTFLRTFERGRPPIGSIRGKNYFAEDIPKALDFVEKEINEFDQVMEGHGDFCALVATGERPTSS